MKQQKLSIAEIDEISLLREIYDRFPPIRQNRKWDDFVVTFYERQNKEDYKILVAFLDEELVAVETSSQNFQVPEMQVGVRELGQASLSSLWLQKKN